MVLQLPFSFTGTVLDEMGTRIDDLEKNIADLMTQAGVDDKWSTSNSAREYILIPILTQDCFFRQYYWKRKARFHLHLGVNHFYRLNFSKQWVLEAMSM